MSTQTIIDSGSNWDWSLEKQTINCDWREDIGYWPPGDWDMIGSDDEF